MGDAFKYPLPPLISVWRGFKVDLKEGFAFKEPKKGQEEKKTRQLGKLLTLLTGVSLSSLKPTYSEYSHSQNILHYLLSMRTDKASQTFYEAFQSKNV